jgi:hypothetical protein
MASKQRSRKSSSRSSRGRHGNAASSLLEEFHTFTWEWTKKAMDDLSKIAKAAHAASKNAPGLANKVELQRISKRAAAGLAVVSRVFGDPV